MTAVDMIRDLAARHLDRLARIAGRHADDFDGGDRHCVDYGSARLQLEAAIHEAFCAGAAHITATATQARYLIPLAGAILDDREGRPL